MRVSYHTFLFLNDVDLPFAIDGNKKVESWLNLFAQSIESIKSWSDDYEQCLIDKKKKIEEPIVVDGVNLYA